ncbi:MAG: hypothetical protein ACRC1H_04095, partial [Caldilineaceae bacterium]
MPVKVHYHGRSVASTEGGFWLPLPPTPARRIALFLLTLAIFMTSLFGAAAFGALRPSVARAQSAGLSEPAAPVIILPASASPVVLQTYTTDLTLITSSGALIADSASFYRLRNEGSTDATVTLRFGAPTESGAAPLPAPLTVTAGGADLPLTP